MMLKGGTDGRKDGRKDGRTDVSKFPPVFYRTSALWGRCPKRGWGMGPEAEIWAWRFWGGGRKN